MISPATSPAMMNRPPNNPALHAAYWAQQAASSPTKAATANTAPATAASAPAPLVEAAREARAVIDAIYEADLKKYPVGHGYPRDEVIDALTKLDRLALFAVRSNAGGMFSVFEQMDGRSAETKIYAEMYEAAFEYNSIDGYRARRDWLDTASPEEKATWEWAESRAAIQANYETLMTQLGLTPENWDSGNAIVNLLVEAEKNHHRQFEELNRHFAYSDAPEDQKQKQLDAAVAKLGQWEYSSARNAILELWKLQNQEKPPFSWIA